MTLLCAEELQKIVGRGNPHTFPLFRREGPRCGNSLRVGIQ